MPSISIFPERLLPLAEITAFSKENGRYPDQRANKKIFASHNEMVGSPIVTADLHDECEFSKVSRPRVARQMKEMGLKCKTTRKFVVTTDSRHNRPVVPNLLNRNSTPHAPNITWVSDITYLKVGRKWYCQHPLFSTNHN